MKRILKIIIVFLIVLFVLTGCESTYYSTNRTLRNQTDRFVEIKRWTDESSNINCIVYDRETLVEYWKIMGGDRYGITILLGADGKPILYKEE